MPTSIPKITIDHPLSQACPKLAIQAILAEVTVEPSSADLWQEIHQVIQDLQLKYTPENYNKQKAIVDSRTAYKALGKDPSRYRLSAEALLRRIFKNKGLYKVNNLVDLLNAVSIQTGFSIGGYDADKIVGDIRFGAGQANEDYQAIGRGELNIEHLPVFRDDLGAFGTPTSDSTRTMVTEETKRFLMLIISFDGKEDLDAAKDIAVTYLKKYAKLEAFTASMVDSK